MFPMSANTTEANALRRSIAEEIRALLGRRNMSRLQLARRINRSHTYMWRRLSGDTAFDTDDLQQIAAVLGVELTDLFPTGAREHNHGYPSRVIDPLAARVIATIGQPRPGRAHSTQTSARPTGRLDHPRVADRSEHSRRPVAVVAQGGRMLTNG